MPQTDTNSGKTWWMMSVKVWIIPVILGIVSAFIDFVFFHNQLSNDLGAWVITILLFFIAFGMLKQMIPVILGNPIAGSWICWGISILVWISRLFFHAPFQFHI